MLGSNSLKMLKKNQEVERAIQSEVATMRLIQQRTLALVATILGYNREWDNPVVYWYMF
jgi:hypothetical protein